MLIFPPEVKCTKDRLRQDSCLLGYPVHRIAAKLLSRSLNRCLTILHYHRPHSSVTTLRSDVRGPHQPDRSKTNRRVAEKTPPHDGTAPRRNHRTESCVYRDRRIGLRTDARLSEALKQLSESRPVVLPCWSLRKRLAIVRVQDTAAARYPRSFAVSLASC